MRNIPHSLHLYNFVILYTIEFMKSHGNGMICGRYVEPGPFKDTYVMACTTEPVAFFSGASHHN